MHAGPPERLRTRGSRVRALGALGAPSGRPRAPCPRGRARPRPGGGGRGPAGRAAPSREIAPGVFVYEAPVALASADNAGAIANVGFVVGRDAVAVIDTGGSIEAGRRLLAAIRQRSDRPIRYVDQHPCASRPRPRQRGLPGDRRRLRRPSPPAERARRAGLGLSGGEPRPRRAGLRGHRDRRPDAPRRAHARPRSRRARAAARGLADRAHATPT